MITRFPRFSRGRLYKTMHVKNISGNLSPSTAHSVRTSTTHLSRKLSEKAKAPSNDKASSSWSAHGCFLGSRLKSVFDDFPLIFELKITRRSFMPMIKCHGRFIPVSIIRLNATNRIAKCCCGSPLSCPPGLDTSRRNVAHVFGPHPKLSLHKQIYHTKKRLIR